MGERTRQTNRGVRGQRAGTDQSRNLGGPTSGAVSYVAQRTERRNNLGIVDGRESDRPIVAEKRLIPVERRGLSMGMPMTRKGEPLG